MAESKMLALNCVAVGDASVFVVKLHERDTVELLKSKIKAARPASVGCRAQELRLYVARPGEDFLKENDSDVRQWQRGNVSNALFRMMIRKKNVIRGEYRVGSTVIGFPMEDGVKVGDIHVLVDVPGANGLDAVMSRASRELSEDTLEQSLIPEDPYFYRHDERFWFRCISTSDVVDDEEPPVIERLDWKECSQLSKTALRARCRAYVEANLGDVLSTHGLCVLDMKDTDNTLNVGVPAFTGGYVDLAILDSAARDALQWSERFPHVKILIKVRQRMKKASSFELTSELIALDLLADGPVIAMLTDLADYWTFIWISEDKHFGASSTSEPWVAFKIVKALLSGSEAEVAYFEEPMNVRKLVQVLPPQGNGGGSGRGRGIRANIGRFYQALSTSGLDIALARTIARQTTRATASFSSFFM